MKIYFDYLSQLNENKKKPAKQVVKESKKLIERFDTTKLVNDLNDKLLTSIRERFLTFEKDLSGIKNAYEGIVDWIHAPFGDTVYYIQIRFNERYTKASDKDEVVSAIAKLMGEYGMKIRNSYDTLTKDIFQIEYFWLDDFSNVSRHIYQKIESLYSSEIDRINNL